MTEDARRPNQPLPRFRSSIYLHSQPEDVTVDSFGRVTDWALLRGRIARPFVPQAPTLEAPATQRRRREDRGIAETFIEHDHGVYHFPSAKRQLAADREKQNRRRTDKPINIASSQAVVMPPMNSETTPNENRRRQTPHRRHRGDISHKNRGCMQKRSA